jgi:hypothetical protein
MKREIAGRGSVTRLLVLFLAAAICLGAAQPTRSGTPEEILKRMQALSAEARDCKDEVQLQKITQELQELAKAYQQAIARTNPTQPSFDQAQAAQAAAKEDLRGKEDEPCYPVFFQGAVTKLLYGVQPKTKCIPVKMRLTWEIEERAIRTDEWPTAIVTYTLEENYPGYLQFVYDPVVPSRIVAYYLFGPSPQKDDKISAKITKGNATGLIAEAYGVPTLYKTFSMVGADHFTLGVDCLSQGVSFGYSGASTSSVAQLDGGISGSYIGLSTAGVIEKPYRLATRIELATTGSLRSVQGVIGIDELQEGLRTGRLVKDFNADYTADYTSTGIPFINKRSGTVTLEVLFNPKIYLVVGPQQGFSSEGPDDKDQFIPASQTYNLRNAGDVPIRFAVSKQAAWLNLSSMSGQLDAGQQQAVTVSIGTAQARALPPGTYTDTLSFTNLNNGSGNTTRSVELRIEDDQRWEVTVKGFEVDTYLQPGKFKNQDGTTGVLHKKVRFDWQLAGRFILRKDKGKWFYKSGETTQANVTVVPDFTPPGIYRCQVIVCAHKAPISKMVGSPLVGQLAGGSVYLRWPPRQPSGCVKCVTNHPAFPKTPYEAEFTSDDFTTEIGSDGLLLKDGYSISRSKADWLRYTVQLKRLK